MNTNEQLAADAKAFDDQFIHNFGPLDPIPIGARALCGVVSTRKDSGEIEPLRSVCCPICVALTEEQ
jgi:hypothetical protein